MLNPPIVRPVTPTQCSALATLQSKAIRLSLNLIDNEGLPLLTQRSRLADAEVKRTKSQGADMITDDKQAELYTSPGGKFIRADTLPRVMAHWRSMRSAQKQSHFIKYDGELYAGEEIDKLQIMKA